MILTSPVGSPADIYTGPAYFQIGGLTLTPGDITDNVLWEIEPLDGWDVPAAVRDRITSRNADHGGWLGDSKYEPRTLELKGKLANIGSRPGGWARLTQTWASLLAAVPSFGAATLVVATPGAPVRQAVVYQDASPILNQSAGVIWEFSFSLTAPDPRRYATEATVASTGLPQTTGGLSLPISLPLSIGATVSSGLIQVVNEGDMSTRPVYTVTGPCPPCSITHSSGRRLVIPEAVDAGRTLVIDTDARTALLDGTANRTVTGAWFDLEPGENEIQFSSATYDAAALLGVSFRSAWR